MTSNNISTFLLFFFLGIVGFSWYLNGGWQFLNTHIEEHVGEYTDIHFDNPYNQPESPYKQLDRNYDTLKNDESSSAGVRNNDEYRLEQMKNSIVWVKYEVTGKNPDGSYFESGGTGSGVIVGNKSNVLKIFTNRHVVDCEFNDINCFQRISEKVEVRTQDGRIHQVDKVSFSKSDIDLALLTIKTSNSLNYPTPFYVDEFDINDKVIAVGYPSYAQNVVEFSVSYGRITKIKEVLSQSTGFGFRVIESDVYTSFGSSGGGLFDERGNLIGINTWRAPGDSIAIDLSSITEDNFVSCSDDSFFADGNCYGFGEREQVMDINRRYYDVCDEFYCESQKMIGKDPRCAKEGYVFGSDGYCHQTCGSPTRYTTDPNAICYKNRLFSCPSDKYLFRDGTCRVYE
jgi:Trypsin-like peptidase domain